jgi:heme O synthase-like polyprenyltransferase
VRFREDYAKANVPMLPAVMEEEKALGYIVATLYCS